MNLPIIGHFVSYRTWFRSDYANFDHSLARIFCPDVGFCKLCVICLKTNLSMEQIYEKRELELSVFPKQFCRKLYGVIWCHMGNVLITTS